MSTIRSPIVTFESRHGATDVALIALAGVNLSTVSSDQAHEMYVRVRNAAESGSTFAMCLCARWPNERGKPTERERYAWAERAAQAGYPPGLFELAVCFDEGINVPRDLTRALQLYERSAAGGYGFADLQLGIGYKEGRFGAADVARAVHFMELAYKEGEPLGALHLGQWFESGTGVVKNLSAAVSWYERASEMGDFFATHRLQLAYMLGEVGLPRDASMAKKFEARLFQQTELEAQDNLPGKSPDRPGGA